MKSQRITPNWEIARDNYELVRLRLKKSADEMAHAMGWCGRRMKYNRFAPGAKWSIEEVLRFSELSGISANDLFTKKIQLS